MKITYLTLAILLSSFSFLTAQCVLYTRDSLAVVCGDSTQILISVSPASLSSPTTNTLNQIHFFDLATGFIAGENGTVLRSTDGGINWALTTFLPDQNWMSVNFVSRQTGFIASAAGKLAKTTDGGLNWNVIFDDASKSFSRIKFINATTGFSIGQQGLILKTTDGGNSWNTIPGGTGVRLNDIVFVNGTKGFIGGNYDYNQNKNILLTTTNAGNTWSNMTVTTEYAEFNSIAFINENTGYVSGNSNSYKTTDGGLSWSPSCWPADDSLALWDETTGFICSQNYVTKFIDSGSSYENFMENSLVSFHDIACPDSHSLFVIGSNGYIGSFHEPVAYHWEPSAGLNADTIANPLAGPGVTTTYIVTVQLSNGTTASDTVNVQVFSGQYYPDLCLVTVDTATSHNRILWNAFQLEVLDSVFLYKEGISWGQLIRLGSFPASQPGEYLDEQSNPALKADAYTISVLDRCSFESDPGSRYSTMHLYVNQGIGATWNLQWEPYGGGQAYTYRIYRGNASGPLQLIDSLSGFDSQYNDLNAPTGDISYLIEAVLNTNCSLSPTGVSSFSNIVWGNGSTHGIADETASAEFILIHNPVATLFSVQSDKLSEIARIRLLSLNGSQVTEWQNPSDPSFDVSSVVSGLYLLNIEMKDHRSFMQKLVKL